MKNLFKSLVVGALLLGSVGCSDMFKEDLYEINNEIDKINQRIDSLCNAVNTNIASLQTIIDVMQDNDYVDSITPIVENGVTIGYEIVFTQSGSVKIYHGKKGDTGHTPIVGVQQAEDGRWYWTIDGEWLLDGEGDKVLAEAIDGIDGEKGEEGITPKLEVRDNYWYISYDNGSTWVQLGKATGENGKDGDSMFKSITYNEDYVELVLADGKTVIKIPTWASHMLLVDEIAKINNNISAIQAAIEALESNDYVQKVTPVKDEDGNVIGYTLQFAFTGDVTIFHGEDGKDGEDGEDGKDGVDGEDGKDGYTPVIGARQHPDGNWYWTVDTEWLLDTNGNRVKTTGEDGTSGITPELKIEDDYWYVSYDKGQTWTKLGKAKGEDGADGSAGTAGDAFFKGVNVTEDYVTFTLADGTEIKIPTWKVYQELADAVAHLNTNVQSMTAIINALQDNDFVTGTTEIVDPQTNEVIGYKLHFSKSGDIEIYHGKTPNAPEIGIKRHEQFGLCWTYNGEYIKDPGTGAPVALPKDGASGVTPQFKIVDGFWFVSMDEGRTWEEVGQATGDQGETGATGGSGDSFFKSVTEEYVKDANGKDVVAYIVMTLTDGSEYRVPTAYITDELTKRIAAIESQFATIQTIVGALQNAEYIKKVEPRYSGPALIGYDITFVKYTLQADGRLTEDTWVSEIRNGGAGTNGTVVEVAYDEKTDTYYWTLDGTPIKDKDGNLIPVEGKDGKTPTVEINSDGYWVINGVNTGVKARGEDGNDGTNGSNASSLFSDVVLEGSYYVFYFTQTGREPIKVPSWKAFEDLQKGVSELEATVASFNAFLNGNQYIKSVTAIDGNRGWDIEVAYYNAETQQWENKHYNIYNGTNGDNGVTPEIPAITVEKDPTDNNYYWKVGGVWLTDAEGNRVRANGTDGADGNNGDPGANGLTPEFRINAETGELEYMFPGDKEWISLGKVVGKDGEDGNDGNNGANGATNIVFASAVQFDENGAYVSYTKENDANKAAWVGIQYGTGSSDFIWVPTYKSFQDLLETLNAVEGRVEAIEEFVNLHKTSIEGIANLSGNVTQLMQDVATLKTLRFIGTPVQTETGWEIPVYDGTGAEVIGEKITLTNGADGTIVTMVEGQDGEMYWKIGDTVTEYRVTGNDGKTPAFQINDITGQLEYKFPDTDWIPLGDVVGSDGTNGSNGATNIILASEVQFNEEGAYVSYSKVTDASQANWVGIIFSEGDNADSNTDDQIIWVPTYKHFEALAERVTVVEGKVQEIEEIVALHTSSLEGLSALSGNVTELMADVAKLKTYKFIGTPVKTETGWEIPVVNGAGEPIEAETITLTNGADGTVVTIVKGDDDKYYWAINGVQTEYAVTGNDGKDGQTPTFRINENGVLEYKFEGDENWIALDKVVGEPGKPGTPGTNGATNVVFATAVNEDGTFTEVEDASQADWVGIIFAEGENADSYDDDQIIWVPTYKNFEALAAQVVAVETRVTTLESTVALHETAINSLVTLSTDVNGLIEDVAKLKTYKFIGTPVKTETGWEIPVVNGAGETVEGETITLTNGADGTIVTMVKGQDGEMYWKIGDTVTEYRVTGNDGKTPIFQINENGVLQYKFEGDETWTTLDKVVGEPGEPGEPGTPGTNGATNVVFASAVKFDENGAYDSYTAAESADAALWVGVQYGTGEKDFIWMPTYKNFQEVQALVTTLNTNVTSLSGLINGKRFITAINENWSGEVNGVQRTGVEITYVEISDNKASEPKTMYIYNGLAGVDGANGATVGVKKWTVAEGGDDKLYWTITLNDAEPTWLLDENGNKVLAVGTDGTPGVPGEPGTPGSTPEFKIDAETGILYWKYDKDEDTAENWKELGKVTGEPGVDALKNVVDNGTYYTITYSDGSTVNVQKWVDASNVSVQFSLSRLGSAITEAEVGGPVTVYYEISGAITGTAKPKISANCEGGYFVSELVQPGGLLLGEYLSTNMGSVTINPTYAFTSGVQNGRLTLFVDYYGITIPVELKLIGTANVEVVETIEVEGSGGTVTIDLTADNIDLDFKNRPALGFSYNYNDFVNRTQKGEKEFVLAEKVGTGEKWISRGDHASAYDNLETLTISPNPTNRWRAGMVVVYPSKDSQVELAHIKIIQKPGETNLANPDKSGPDDPANCYIVYEPGRYLIPTYKGNDNSQTYDFSTIDTPISDGTGITISTPEKVVRDGKLYIMFDVNMSQTAGTSDVVNNNSMIAVRDASGNVVWSWHLWLTSGAIEGTDFGPIGNETYNTNATMLNRNLGASAARNTGLYYKWGDKDPFFTPTGGSADYHGGTDSGSWVTADGSKALTDPCPPGYKVPSTAVWNPNQNQLTTFGTDYFTYEGSPLVLYPYSGYIDESKKHIGLRTSKIADQTHDGEIIGYYEFPTQGASSNSLLGGLYSPRRYRNVVFEIQMDMNSGLAHALDGYFIYGYNDAGLDNFIELLTSEKCKIVSCERQVGTLKEGEHYTKESGWFSTTYKYTGAEPNWPSSWETLDSNWFNSGSGITQQAARAAELANLKTELKNYLEKNQSLVSSEIYDQVLSVDTTNGLQVRCVSIGSTVK